MFSTITHSLLFILTFFIFVQYVVSFSGNIPPSCDAEGNFGCTSWGTKLNDDSEVVEDRLNCTDGKGGNMWWAGAPTYVPDYYSLTTRNGILEYTPEGTTFLHLEVLEYGLNYRGFVMYAINSNGDKVGKFSTLPSDIYYYIPPVEDNHYCARVVMHLSAAIKPTLNIFRYEGPPQGTGDIIFKVLIKYGDANTGEFYRPNSEDFKLSEGKKKSSGNTWVQSEPGESCTQACNNINLKCDEKGTTISNVEEYNEEIVPNNECELPGFAICSDIAPFTGIAEEYSGLCYYKDPTCTNNDAKTCDVSGGEEEQRLCACDSPAIRLVTNTGIVWKLIYILCFIMFLSSTKRMSFLFILLCIIFVFLNMGTINMVHGHNWIGQFSRSFSSASQVAPCPASRSPKPQIQVANNGQEFQIEWSSGHGRYLYFVLIEQNKSDLMSLHTDDLLDKYILDAIEAGEDNLMYDGNGNPNKYQKFHRSFDSVINVNVETKFEKEITGGQYFFPRHSNFTWRSDDTPIRQYQYTKTALQGDTVIIYNHPEFYWIKAVWKYEVEYHHPFDMDFAWFWIPQDLSGGRYIMHYIWGGYYDCIDIDVLEQSIDVDELYGTFVPGQVDETRVDHCFYKNPVAFFSPPMEVVHYDLDPCIHRCEKQKDRNCAGIQIFPFHYPLTVPERWREYLQDNIFYQYVNDSFYPYEWPVGIENDVQAERYFDNDELWVDNGEGASLRSSFLQKYIEASKEKLYCMPISPAPPTDTTSIFITTEDPRDPVFYGTCFQRVPKIDFIGYGNFSTQGGAPGPFKFLDKCLDCDSYRRNSKITSPTWNILNETEVCYDCDIILEEEEGELPIDPLPPRLLPISPGSRCKLGDWSTGDLRPPDSTCIDIQESCQIHLGGVGWDVLDTTRNVELCAYLAAMEPNCKQNTYWIDTDFERVTDGEWGCRCYKKEPTCCGECIYVREPGSAIAYEFLSQGEEIIPDPKCERGLLSDNSLYCCTSNCARCASNVDDFTEIIGTCRTGRIDGIEAELGHPRTCDLYGPPCIMVV